VRTDSPWHRMGIFPDRAHKTPEPWGRQNLSAAEVAELLQCSLPRVCQLANEGRLRVTGYDGNRPQYDEGSVVRCWYHLHGAAGPGVIARANGQSLRRADIEARLLLLYIRDCAKAEGRTLAQVLQVHPLASADEATISRWVHGKQRIRQVRYLEGIREVAVECFHRTQSPELQRYGRILLQYLSPGTD